VKELLKTDRPGFKPEDVYFETPEEGMERVAEGMVSFAELTRERELNPVEARVISE